MKRKINYCLAIITLTLIAACTKDQNNFSYEEAFDFKISDDVEDVIHVRQGDTLRLSPEFDDSRGEFSYLWFAWRNNGSIGYRNDRDTLGTTKNLAAVIKPSYYILGEPYKLTYQVTNNKTGVSAYYFYDLLISNIFTEGWLVLEEKNGLGDFSMILPDGEVVHNIYSSLNPSAPVQDPIMLSLSNGNVNDDVNPAGRKFYLVGKNDIRDLNVLTMQKRSDFDFLFFQPPAVRDLSFAGWSGTSLGVIVNEGLLITNFVGGFPGAKKFGLYMQAPEVEYNYEMAPFVANVGSYDWRAHPAVFEHIMYDQKNKRFYNVSGQNISAFPTNASNPSIFNLNNVGLSMHFMGRAHITNAHNAIMYDGTGAYILQFKSLTTEGNPITTLMKQQMSAPNILQTVPSCIATSTLTPHIFYGYGNVLYKYEVTSNTTTELHRFGNETIHNVKFRSLADGVAEIVIATGNSTDNKVYKSPVSVTGEFGGITAPPSTGFNRILGLTYKTPN